MSNSICPPAPVVIVASHEELVRSARDMWAVTVSLLTELTPDKFATAPWAAGLFSVELPFILGKLWHLQQGLIVSAHSYMQTESTLTTFIETIDVPKLLKELAPWILQLNPATDLPIGVTQHVPPVKIMHPEDVQIIEQRLDETNASGQPLVRHEIYQFPNRKQHWFYLSQVDENSQSLRNLVKESTNEFDQVYFVARKDGEVIIPDVPMESAEGTVTVYELQNL